MICNVIRLLQQFVVTQLSTRCRLSQHVHSVVLKRKKSHSSLWPLVCISPSPPQSCHAKLIELFSKKLYLIGLAALAVAVIMVSVKKCVRKTPAFIS